MASDTTEVKCWSCKTGIMVQAGGDLVCQACGVSATSVDINEQVWEYAVFEEFAPRIHKICGRPYFTQDGPNGLLEYLKEQHPQSKFSIRRRMVGRWEDLENPTG